MRPSSSRPSAFTLIELLVVIAIIGVLAVSVAFEATRARASARNGRAKSDLVAMGAAVEAYANLHEDALYRGSACGSDTEGLWTDSLAGSAGSLPALFSGQSPYYGARVTATPDRSYRYVYATGQSAAGACSADKPAGSSPLESGIPYAISSTLDTQGDASSPALAYVNGGTLVFAYLSGGQALPDVPFSALGSTRGSSPRLAVGLSATLAAAPAPSSALPAGTTLASETARPAGSFTDFVGVNNANGTMSAPFDYEADTNYQELQELHISHVRVSGPSYLATNPTHDSHVMNLLYLSSLGIRSMLTTKLAPVSSYTIQPSDEVAVADYLNAQRPGTVEAVEGANENYVNKSNPPTGYDFSQPPCTGPAVLPDFSDPSRPISRPGYSYAYPVGATCTDWSGPMLKYAADIAAAFRADAQAKTVPLVGPTALRSRSTDPAVISDGQLDPWVDTGNVHDYSYPYSVSWNTSWFDKRSQQEGIYRNRLPLVMGETGYSDGNDPNRSVTTQAKAKLLPRQLLDVFERTAGDAGLGGDPGAPIYKRAYVYQMVSSCADTVSASGTYTACPGTGELGFGLVKRVNTLDASGKVASTSFTKTPAYYTLKNLMDLLYDAGTPPAVPGSLDFSLTGDTADVRHALFQRSDGSFDLVLYADVDSNAGNPLTPSDTNPAPSLPKAVTLTLGSPALVTSYATYATDATAPSAKRLGKSKDFSLAVPDYPLVLHIGAP